jgi:hypothetical protein
LWNSTVIILSGSGSYFGSVIGTGTKAGTGTKLSKVGTGTAINYYSTVPQHGCIFVTYLAQFFNNKKLVQNLASAMLEAAFIVFQKAGL